MRRRTVLQLIAMGGLSPEFDPLRAAEACQATHPAGAAEPYQLRFFSPAENELLDQLMELIIPADQHSPGAHAARVSLFADWMVAHSSDAVKGQWRSGLRRMKEEAGNSSLQDALAKAAANEAHPASELDRFFILLKHMTIDGYYTSEIGIHKDLQYRGNEYLLQFPGCTHPEHQA